VRRQDTLIVRGSNGSKDKPIYTIFISNLFMTFVMKKLHLLVSMKLMERLKIET
jgi:hypothetical protein